MDSISERIAALRTGHHLSQQQLADNLKVSRRAVSLWETGRRQPDIHSLIQMADYFNVTLDYLVKREPEKAIKKHFTARELFEYIQSYQAVLFCGVSDGYSVLCVRLRTCDITFHEGTVRGYASIEGSVRKSKQDFWTEGVVYLAGTEFECSTDKEGDVTTMIVNSDYMGQPVKMNLYR